MGPRKKKSSKKRSKKEKPPLILDDEKRRIALSLMMKHDIGLLKCRVMDLERQNQQLRTDLGQRIEDKDTLIGGFESQSKRNQKCIEKLLKEQAHLEEEKDVVHSELSMKLAQQSRELQEAQTRINELLEETAKSTLLREELQAAKVRNEVLMVIRFPLMNYGYSDIPQTKMTELQTNVSKLEQDKQSLTSMVRGV